MVDVNDFDSVGGRQWRVLICPSSDAIDLLPPFDRLRVTNNYLYEIVDKTIRAVGGRCPHLPQLQYS